MKNQNKICIHYKEAERVCNWLLYANLYSTADERDLKSHREDDCRELRNTKDNLNVDKLKTNKAFWQLKLRDLNE